MPKFQKRGRKDVPVSPPDELFEPIVDAFRGRTGVTTGRMFGSTVLKANGKVFAMLVKGKLVVKLNRERVDAMVAAGAGEYFDPGHGRPSKEWVAIGQESQPEWQRIAGEALTVASG